MINLSKQSFILACLISLMPLVGHANPEDQKWEYLEQKFIVEPNAKLNAPIQLLKQIVVGGSASAGVVALGAFISAIITDRRWDDIANSISVFLVTSTTTSDISNAALWKGWRIGGLSGICVGLGLAGAGIAGFSLIKHHIQQKIDFEVLKEFLENWQSHKLKVPQKVHYLFDRILNTSQRAENENLLIKLTPKIMTMVRHLIAARKAEVHCFGEKTV